MRILIKNGTIVTSTEKFNSDIYIYDGRITRIEPEIPFSPDDKVIDATGYYVSCTYASSVSRWLFFR
jgi:dihydroorotase-like cyclic amidohydrolase